MRGKTVGMYSKIVTELNVREMVNPAERGFIRPAKRLVIAALLIMAACVALFLWKGKAHLSEGKLLVFTRESTTYFNPLFSPDGKGIAFLEAEAASAGDPAAPRGTRVWTGTVKKAGSKAVPLPMKGLEGAAITSYDREKQLVVYEKTEYRSFLKSAGNCDIGLGSCQEPKAPEKAGAPACESPDRKRRAAVEKSPPSQGPAKLVLEEEGKERATLMEALAEKDSFNGLAWQGDNFFFQYHTLSGLLYHNELWWYSCSSQKLTRLSEDCFNAVASPGGDKIAYLVPQDRESPAESPRKACWQLVVKDLGDEKPKLLSEERSDEELFLYGWAPDGESLLVQKGSSLLCHRPRSGESKPLVAADEGLWWGLPLSPYYLAWSPDSSRIALLCYTINKDRGTYTEALFVIDAATGRKKAVHEHELRSLKFAGPVPGGFHRRVVWSPDGTSLLFEGKRNDVSTDILLASPDGRGSKNLTGSMRAFFFR
ncbi:MAG: hypothetical protein RDV48_07350 [Candidatus Eremiobacteraeota bacterium]|nr:hypothetical protein [Candidatus Eremiobacteraeota bacterium]